MRPLDPRLVRHAKVVRTLIVASVTISAASAACVIIQAVLLARIIAEVVMHSATLEQLRGSLIGLAAAILIRAGLGWAGEEIARRSAARMTAQLRRALLEHVVAAGPRWSQQQRASELVTLATTGIDSLDAYASRYLPQLVVSCIVPVSMVAWMTTADLISTLIVALTLPLVPLFMALVGWHTERQTRRRLHALDVLSGHFLDVIRGLPTLKVFGRSRAQAESVRRTTAEYRKATGATLRVAFLSSLVLELLSTLSVALVAVAIGLRLVHGELSLETGLAVLILAPEAYLPLRALGAQFHSSADGLAAAERVLMLLDEPIAPAGTVRAIPSPAAVALRLRGAAVTYPDRRDDGVGPIDATIAAGRITVLVGPSGAGKTTLLHLLGGLLQPDRGAVLIDDHDLAAVDPDTWRSMVGYLAQRPAIVAGTIADNLRLGNADAPDAALQRALKAAGADDFVRSLPDGLAAEVGQGGARLSAGQRQRLGLARALLRDAPLLLLDEPTSALDTSTEQRVLAGIRAAAAGRTVVIASHRAAVAAIADHLLDVATAPIADSDAAPTAHSDAARTAGIDAAPIAAAEAAPP